MNNQTEFLSLPSGFYKLIIIKRISFIVVAISAIVINRFVFNKEKLPDLAFWMVLSAIVLFGILLLFMAKVYFKNKKYRLFDKNLTFRSGVLVHTEVVVPFSRIQHVEIDEGPLERFFGLATLSIYTAGDSGKDLKINGLEVEKAQEIKDFVTNYIKNE